MSMERIGLTKFISNDWDDTAIPVAGRQPFYRVAIVWVNFVFVPVFIGFAFDLGSRMAYPTFLASIFVGGLILAICSAITGVIGQQTGLSAGLLLRRVFGSSGGRLTALIPPIALVGWDSFSLDLVGRVTGSLTGRDELRIASIIVFMILFAIPAILGFRGIAIVSIITSPMIIVLLLGALAATLSRGNNIVLATPNQPIESFPSAVTKVVGLFALGSTTCSPDLQRFCRTSREATLVSIVTFLFALPFLLIVPGTAALLVNNGSALGSFTAIGLVEVGYITFLLLSWSTCHNDYYSASLDLSAVSGLRRSVLVLPVGIIAAIIAIVGVGKYLEPWLVLMTTIAIPLCGVIIAEAWAGNISFQNEKIYQWRPESFISWVIGAIVTYYSTKIQFGIPPLPGIVAAIVLQFIMLKGLSNIRSRPIAKSK
jgi:cytosine permease